MGKSNGGAGRSGGSAKTDKGYGDGVDVVSYNNRPENALSFSSYDDIKKVVIVKAVDENSGSEKQVDYAESVKVRAMSNLDRVAAGYLNTAPDKGAVRILRNKIMSKLNNETNARTILNNILPIQNNVNSLAAYYNIKP